MHEAVVAPLPTWQNFYVIIGSAAAALTGLMFVVITLIAGKRDRGSNGEIGAFGTPTVVHFCAALLIAAILSAPWQALWHVSLPLGLAGLVGLIYIGIIARRMRLQAGYQSVLEDWLWHAILPSVAYIVLVVAAIMLPNYAIPSLFAIGAATLLLLFIGIHNAWDTVTYITLKYSAPEKTRQDK